HPTPETPTSTTSFMTIPGTAIFTLIQEQLCLEQSWLTPSLCITPGTTTEITLFGRAVRHEITVRAITHLLMTSTEEQEQPTVFWISALMSTVPRHPGIE